MKKIGIVTWYDKGFNYGSTLQAFAMQIYLESKGYECELINYKPENKNIKKIIKEILKRIYLLIFNFKVLKNWNKMSKWIKKNIKQSKTIFNYDELKKYSQRYDAVICGSDQIWSNSNNKVNPFYYLQFIDEEKRISYAPSIARDHIDEEIKKIFSNYIKQIRYLSVREEKGAELIQECTGKKAEVVIDPTFLIKKDKWENLSKFNDKKLIKEPYIFVYLLSKNEEYFKQIQKIAEERKLKIVTVPMIYSKNKLAVEANHSEFLNLIRNSKYVITDSFHGIAFSIILEKDFVVYKRFKDDFKQSENSRIYNILKKFDLYDRMVTEENQLDSILENNINYSNVEIEENKFIKQSEKYLIEALTNVIN